MDTVILQRRRKQRASAQAYAAAIVSPITTPVTLPAGGRLAFVATGTVAAGDTAGTITGSAVRTTLAPDMVAGERIVIDWAEKSSVVTIGANFDLYLNTKFGEYAKVGVYELVETVLASSGTVLASSGTVLASGYSGA